MTHLAFSTHTAASRSKQGPAPRRSWLGRRKAPLLLAALWWLPTTSLFAHDLWFEPSTHHPKLGQNVGVVVQIGEHLKGEPITLAGARVRELFMADSGGRQPVAVLRGRLPALLVRPQRPGTQVLAYWSLPIPITIAADKFNPYLVEEGLQQVLAERERLGQMQEPGREAYVRCAKALLHAGPEGTPLQDRALGLPLELVAAEGLVADAESQALQLLFNGKPLAGALVMAMNSNNPAEAQSQRTDASGRVRFDLRRDGRWLVKAVHMQRAAAAAALPSAEDNVQADWNSWWASLTFAWPKI